jgi:hypothetical protein
MVAPQQMPSKPRAGDSNDSNKRVQEEEATISSQSRRRHSKVRWKDEINVDERPISQVNPDSLDTDQLSHSRPSLESIYRTMPSTPLRSYCTPVKEEVQFSLESCRRSSALKKNVAKSGADDPIAFGATGSFSAATASGRNAAAASSFENSLSQSRNKSRAPLLKVYESSVELNTGSQGHKHQSILERAKVFLLGKTSHAPAESLGNYTYVCKASRMMHHSYGMDGNIVDMF